VNSDTISPDNFTESYFARRSWLAYTILAFNVLVFAVMLKFSLLPVRWTLISGNDYATLINFGAKTNIWLLQQKQWFRLVTPIFIHIGLLHLVTNSYALWIVGPIVERLYGSAKFAVLYLLTGSAGVAGSVLSAWIYKADGPAAGASGALFGLFGVLIVVSYKYRRELPAHFRRAFRNGVLSVVAINLLFGVANNFSKSLRLNLPFHFVDNWAHVAGLLAGAGLAMILPYSRPEKKQNSKLEKTLLIISLLVVSYCFWRAYQLRPFIFQR
jgi:rhomboid protease GluP